MRNQTDLLALYRSLESELFAHDFYRVMRQFECLFPDKPRWGEALRPADEPLRLGQNPSLAFAPAGLARFEPKEKGERPRLEVNFFGMLGPNGPLPLHLTDYARQRVLHHGDRTFVRFLDLIHHRFLVLFYRAWAQAQPTVSLDRPEEDRFSYYLASLFGLGQVSLRERDAVPDHAKLFQTGALARQIRNAEGLREVLSAYFGLPVEILPFMGHWLPLDEGECSRLGACSLGRNTVLGRRVWDRQSKFRIRIGPMSLDRYEDFLPGGTGLKCLVDWVRLYCGLELFWDVQLVLKREEVPAACLGKTRLGFGGWLGERQIDGDADELVLDAEKALASRA